MGYVLRVRFASFFTGAAVASAAGLYVLQKDYKIAHQGISEQVSSLYESLDRRVSALEKFKEVEASKPVETAD
ncbi:uncharacterized protein LOC105156054 [Sesamum indicum]|uniref:Uncharacterized protein LOC105156054 n=1 Tax=Sesamum indicum TaxID=4182 RepID=A0A6I9SKG9_SESIN|nr:uncharacterized protein LOC105156054 [Sesamum indicum]